MKLIKVSSLCNKMLILQSILQEHTMLWRGTWSWLGFASPCHLLSVCLYQYSSGQYIFCQWVLVRMYSLLVSIIIIHSDETSWCVFKNICSAQCFTQKGNSMRKIMCNAQNVCNYLSLFSHGYQYNIHIWWVLLILIVCLIKYLLYNAY